MGDPVNGQRYETFMIEFLLSDHKIRRTRITHVQTGAEERWAGWDKRRLLRTLRDQLSARSSEPGPG